MTPNDHEDGGLDGSPESSPLIKFLQIRNDARQIRLILVKNSEKRKGIINRHAVPFWKDQTVRYTVVAVSPGMLFSIAALITKSQIIGVVALVFLILAYITLPFIMLYSIKKSWDERSIESLKNSNASAEVDDELIEQLAIFSRASLSYAFDDLNKFEARVDRRASLLIGSRTGGLLTVIAFAVAGFSALDRVFSGNPTIYTPNIQTFVWLVLLFITTISLAAILGRHSVNTVAERSALIKQIIDAKKISAEEEKEDREKRKFEEGEE